MTTKDLARPMTEVEQEMARTAQRCIVEALDHSHAAQILLPSDDGSQPASVALPPQALRQIAQLLGALSEGKVVTILPSNRELSTLEAAHMLGVSRPFLIKQMEAGHLAYRVVGSHRRVTLDALKEFGARMEVSQSAALQRMADNAADLGLDY
jgi:excisionase family DNA binding protein